MLMCSDGRSHVRLPSICSSQTTSRRRSLLEKVVVHKEGEVSIASDHNRIFLHFCIVHRTGNIPQRKITTQLREGDEVLSFD